MLLVALLLAQARAFQVAPDDLGNGHPVPGRALEEFVVLPRRDPDIDADRRVGVVEWRSAAAATSIRQ
jgi:hypothetical protein